jgi:thiamine kinase-like enzyme
MNPDYSWIEDSFQTEIQKTKSQTDLIGYYNQNFIVTHLGQKYLLRIPLANASSMDLRLIPENTVLNFLEQYNYPAPRLLHSTTKFNLHSYIDGNLFHDLYPLSTPFPDWIPKNLAKQIYSVHAFPSESFHPYCSNINFSPNTSDFFQIQLDLVQNIYNSYNSKEFFQQLEIPNDPFVIPKKCKTQLTNRPFVFAHCDIHRKNLIHQNPMILIILDWELCLITDPLYDIAVHFHKMRYQPHQEILFLETYLRKSKNNPLFKENWEQIQIYLNLERIKSAIVDAIRYYGDFQNKNYAPDKMKEIVGHYYNKLQKANKIWYPKSGNPISHSDILRIFKKNIKLE